MDLELKRGGGVQNPEILKADVICTMLRENELNRLQRARSPFLDLHPQVAKGVYNMSTKVAYKSQVAETCPYANFVI